MKRLASLVALCLCACASTQHAPTVCLERVQSGFVRSCAPSSAHKGFGNISVLDANGATRIYNTTVDGSGIQTPHMIVDAMPPISIGDITVGTVDQGDAQSLHTQAWKVLLSDGSAALGTASNPVRVSPGTSPADQPVVGKGSPGSPSGGVLSVQGVASGTAMTVSASTLPLPSGAATESTLSGLLTSSTFTGRIPANGQQNMAGSIPVVVASNQSSLPVVGAAANGAAVSGAPVRIGGSDGTSTRDIKTDTSGNQVMVGAGTPGSGAGGVLTVQGNASGTAVPVSGTVTTQSEGTTGSSAPSKASLIGGSDGSSLRALKTATDGTLEAESQPSSAAAYFAQISCTTSAGRVDSGTSHAMTRGFWLTCDSGGGDVYAGGSGVTSSNGFKIAAGQAWFFEETNTNNLYFISSTGTVKCYVYGK